MGYKPYDLKVRLFSDYKHDLHLSLFYFTANIWILPMIWNWYCLFFWQRNYIFFFMFVASTTLLCIYAFAISALYIKFLMDGDAGTVWEAMRESPASVILMIYTFISVWFVGGLTIFHLYLISSNQVSVTKSLCRFYDFI